MKIELRDVGVRRGAQVAVDGVSLAIASGELLAVLGPSGSGKTTLLMAIAGLHESSGAILLDGTDAQRTPPRERGLGMVFQDLALWPHLTVAGHLRFVLRGRRRSGAMTGSRVEQDERIAATLALVELTALAGRLPAQLSGGEAQRLALARALVVAPRALLLDEPLGALDRRLRGAMIDLLRAVHVQRRTTTLLVTHDWDEAFALADRIAVLDRGRLRQVDGPEAVYRRPADAGVAELGGPVSLVAGTRAGDRVALPFGTFGAAFAAGVGDGCAVSAVLRPEDVAGVDGTDGAAPGEVVATRFRGGRSEVEVRVGSHRVWATATARRAIGTRVALRLVEPLWCVAARDATGPA